MNCWSWSLPAVIGCQSSRFSGRSAGASKAAGASNAPARRPHSHSGGFTPSAPGRARASSQSSARRTSWRQSAQEASPKSPLLSPQPSRSIVSTSKPAAANARAARAIMRRDLFISSAKGGRSRIWPHGAASAAG